MNLLHHRAYISTDHNQVALRYPLHHDKHQAVCPGPCISQVVVHGVQRTH
eukprot:CAMPEP_0182560718 /NCGR_PEP_ID=MMETSP1324-20130603/3306_1 /TAXON_ID=236786 /ORGANISM="Florenciella sp., Strain RCC1587" /LENGTH=49 /DNA_ID=CAMNT_0024773105 /DNA_START=717 /DNA_END=866 /DNA_ORIENTATION=-